MGKAVLGLSKVAFIERGPSYRVATIDRFHCTRSYMYSCVPSFPSLTLSPGLHLFIFPHPLPLHLLPFPHSLPLYLLPDQTDARMGELAEKLQDLEFVTELLERLSARFKPATPTM